MTNIEAYISYNPDKNMGILSLGLYDVDPNLEDKNSVSSAIGMIDKAFSPDYKQGSTAETLTPSIRSFLLQRGKKILIDNGIEYTEPYIGPIITSKSW